jgi:predicted RNA-binding protein YlqC (UPF0109 family)
MPYEIKQIGIHYMVRNKDTGKVFAKHTSAVNAIRQVNLLRMQEANRNGH